VPEEIKGSLDGSGLRFAIVVSSFHENVTSMLLKGALDALSSHGVQDGGVTVIWVPGSFEIPQAAKHAAKGGAFAAVVCLGAVIRHHTDHYKYIAEAAAQGIASAARETGVPMAFGVLTTDSEEQALERAGGKEGNRGYDAALSALQMATLFRTM